VSAKFLLNKPRFGDLMLVAYFDESRRHDKTSGRDTQVVVGGAITSTEQWRALSKKWESALATEGLSCFHMSKFESRKGEYDKWLNRENERKAFLNVLLDIISQHIVCIIGTRVSVSDNGRFADTYVEAVRKTIVNATQDVAHTSKEKISLVFAVQPEISHKRIITYCDKLKRLAIPNLHACSGADPKSTLPLQVADLLSYEIMKWDGGWNPITWRYPLRKLRSGTVTFHVV
jgi:hypothetical protein